MDSEEPAHPRSLFRTHTFRLKLRANRRLLMIVSCWVTIIDMGLVFSFGSLFVAMMDIFQTDRSTTAIVQSLLVGTTLSFGVVSGILVSRLGLTTVTLISSVLVVAGLFMSFFATSIYYLYISIGIVSGTGTSMAIISCLTIAGQAFPETQRTFCITAINISIPLGALIYPFCLEWLREHYGLYGTFLILSGITGNTFILSVVCLLNRGEIDKGVVSIGTRSKAFVESDGSCIGRKRMQEKTLVSVPFVCLLTGVGLSVGALNGFIQLLLDISVWKGLTETQGLTSFVVYHFFSVVSRLFPAAAQHTKSINGFVCAMTSALSGCIGQAVLYLTTGILPYIVGISFSSVALGGILSSSLILVVEIVRQEQKPIAYGLLYTVNGFVSTVAGYTLGKSRDVTGSYTYVLLTVGGVQLIAAMLFFVAFIYWRRELSREAVTLSRNTALLATSDIECEQ